MFIGNSWGLVALIAVPLVYLLHRLRQRPRKQNVSSLFIWNKLDEFLSSKPLRKPRQIYLILIMQMLAVTFLALALAEPAWRTMRPAPMHLVFLIDDSASLGSNLMNHPGTRWDILKAQIKKVIEKVPADSIVSFYTPEARTFNRADAIKALAGLKVQEVPRDIESLVQAAKGIQGELYFCSDKMPSETVIKELGQPPHFILVGQPSHNRAIISAAATPTKNKENYYDVFAAIKDYSPITGVENVAVKLWAENKDGEKQLAQQNIILKNGKEWGAVFNSVYVPDKPILKIAISPDDEMVSDNTAWLLPAEKTRPIMMVGRRSPALARALESITSVPVTYTQNGPAERAINGPFIYLYNETVPTAWFGQIVVINGAAKSTADRSVLPGQIRWQYDGEITNPIITKVDFTSPLVQYCDLETLKNIPYAQRLTPAEAEYFKPIIEAKGAQGEECVLLGEWHKGNQRALIINFPMEWRTDLNPNDWTSTPTFPIFWANIMNYFGGQTREPYYIDHSNRQTIKPIVGSGAYLSLCDEKASNNNGITLIDTAIPPMNTLPLQESKKIDFAGWLIGLAGILLLISWGLASASAKPTTQNAERQ